MLFSDNQTKHFYVLSPSTGSGNSTTNYYAVKDLDDSNLFRINITHPSDGNVDTTDVIDRKLIKKIKINEIKPTFLRKWTITAPTVTPDRTYYLYFYLENLMGFGMQDRWDKVASYTAKSGDTVAIVMTALAKDLDLKLNGLRDTKQATISNYLNSNITSPVGPISNDFKVSIDTTNYTITVEENPASDTFKQLTDLDLRMHTNPYAYNVTMSTGMTTERGIEPWSEGLKQVPVSNTNNKLISSYTKALAMELYFLRNRGDMYDLTKDFYISILNNSYMKEESNSATYYTLDIDYAFSDTQGYTYHSDKQLSIVSNAATLQTLKAAILKDSNETAWSVVDNATYTNATGDND